jgi:catechol 2,3-dioxygenase-like lactoylglutathione lyase family enzyme
VVVVATIKEARPMLAVRDLEAAKTWWADTFGLEPARDLGDQGVYYEVGSSNVFVYPSQFAGTNQATAMGLHVDDLDATVAGLRSAGMTFEEYDFPGLKTENGIATLDTGDGTIRVAWFKDPDGNIISIGDE